MADNTLESTSRGIAYFEGLGEPLPVIAHRIKNLRNTNPLGFRLTVENLGGIPAAGKVLLWAWPDRGAPFLSAPEVRFRLAPGEVSIHEFDVDAGTRLKEVRVGAQLRDDDLRPTALRVAVRR